MKKLVTLLAAGALAFSLMGCTITNTGASESVTDEEEVANVEGNDPEAEANTAADDQDVAKTDAEDLDEQIGDDESTSSDSSSSETA